MPDTGHLETVWRCHAWIIFYAASFILGTRRGGINIKEAGNNCKPPSDEFTELEYCAINKFNFAVQAGGK